MKENVQKPIDASGSPAAAGTEPLVPSSQVREREKTVEVMTIDYTSEHTNGHGPIAYGHATGPRTELGKQRSSRNAIRHGIFSQAILLKGESRAEFDLLRTELWDAL